jgi:hypothetical protein
MHRHFYPLVLGLVYGLLSPWVAAAAITTDSISNATGITSLTVDSVQYNVVFEPTLQSFNAVYGSGVSPGLTFTTLSAAQDAVTAIDTVLNAAPAILTVGTTSHSAVAFIVPYSATATTYQSLRGVHTPTRWVTVTAAAPERDTLRTASYTLFTPVSTSVPEPASSVIWGLIVSGAVAVGAYVRRRAAQRGC